MEKLKNENLIKYTHMEDFIIKNTTIFLIVTMRVLVKELHELTEEI